MHAGSFLSASTSDVSHHSFMHAHTIFQLINSLNWRKRRQSNAYLINIFERNNHLSNGKRRTHKSQFVRKKYESFKAPQTSATIWAFKHIFMRKFSPTNWLTFCYMPDTLWSPPGWMSMAGPHEVGHNSMGTFTDKMVVTFFNARHLMMPIQWVPRPLGPPLRQIFIGFVTSSKIKDSTLRV